MSKLDQARISVHVGQHQRNFSAAQDDRIDVAGMQRCDRFARRICYNRAMENNIQPGTMVEVRALRADGVCYRWWSATVEQASNNEIVVNVPAGTIVHGTHGWVQHNHIRAWYWLDRWYNLLEVRHPDGTPDELYIHIASPAQVQQRVLHYVDHELDVVKRPGEAARIVDEEEFAHAVATYNYSAELQHTCRAAAQEALHVAAHWWK